MTTTNDIKALSTESSTNGDIKALSLEELEGVIRELEQPRYRAAQVYEWLHTHNASSYDEMTNVPKALRAALAERFPLNATVIREVARSNDGSSKYLMEFSDGILAETVAIVDANTDIYSNLAKDEGDLVSKDSRITVCVSSQAGCAMECAFCATGKQGFKRNLSTDEIVSQVSLVERDLGQRINNVVVMGQGEPFLNYDNTIDAIRRMNRDKGLGIGARHITVSTSGICEGIYDFTDEPEQFRLAVSLHSADQPTRNELMPRLSGQPLHTLKKALKFYCDVKGRRITLEYILLDGVNDSDEQLERLIEFCSGLNAHINVLEFNPIKGTSFKPTPKWRVQEWVDQLNSNGVTASIRHSRGRDVLGACGQLASA